MNESAATAVGTIRGWKGMFRPVWASQYREVQEGGQTVYYGTASEAECAAWRVLHTIEQSTMLRDGEKLQAISSADAAFNLKPFVKQRGSERRTVVERRATA
jgi:hypothetical protein